MSISFWIKDECVMSLDGVSIHPREGETVRLDQLDHKGYYRVKKLVWSYRQIPTGIENRPPMKDDRLEIHLVRR